MAQTASNYFFIAVLSVVIVLATLTFLPFLAPLVLAAALAVIFAPLHKWVLFKWFHNKEKSSLAAVVTLILIAAIIFVPLTLIALQISGEIGQTYSILANSSHESPILTKLQSIFGSSFNLVDLLRSGANWALTNLNDIFTKITKLVVEFFIMLLALFYLLRDGRELKRQLVALSPLGDVDDSLIFRKLETAIRSIFAGSIAVGIVQGILTGVGFAIFGVPNPVLWGLVAALAALIPGIGTALVILPALLYLFFVGSTGAAIGLLIWGVVFVGLIDNFLGPILVNRGVKIHPFLILLSVFGGIALFGPIGFVLGPLIIALLFALLEIYRNPKVKAPQQ